MNSSCRGSPGVSGLVLFFGDGGSVVIVSDGEKQ